MEGSSNYDDFDNAKAAIAIATGDILLFSHRPKKIGMAARTCRAITAITPADKLKRPRMCARRSEHLIGLRYPFVVRMPPSTH